MRKWKYHCIFVGYRYQNCHYRNSVLVNVCSEINQVLFEFNLATFFIAISLPYFIRVELKN